MSGTFGHSLSGILPTWRRMEAAVKAVRQFALMVAVLLPLVTPAMACVIPGAHLTPAERACCKQMASQCGQMQMPMSHGCCQKDIPAANGWNLAQIQSNHVYTGLSATASLPLIGFLQIPSGLPSDVAQPGITLPQSPPALVIILRI